MAERAQAGATARVVVFDFDGVLVRGDSFETFLRARLRRAPWRLLTVLPLLPFVPLLMLSAWGKGWLARLFTRVATLGSTEDGFRRSVRMFAEEFSREPRHFRAQAVARLRGHLVAGERVIVCSATEQQLLDALLATLGLSAVERAGSEVAVSRWGGLRVLRHNYGDGKRQMLAQRFGLSRWHVAYSDAWSDLPLLRGADEEAVLVNPPQALLERYSQRLGERLRTVRWD